VYFYINTADNIIIVLLQHVLKFFINVITFFLQVFYFILFYIHNGKVLKAFKELKSCRYWL